MTAEAVSKDKLFAHADILDKGDMGRTVIGAGAAFDAGTNVAGQSCRPIAAFDCFEKLGRF